MSPLLEPGKAALVQQHVISAAHARADVEGGVIISTEVELKLAAPAPELQKLKCVLLAMPTVRSEVQSDLTSTYYDTLDLALHRKLLTLRVRKQGRKFVQTVKAGDLAGPDLLARREGEDPIASRRPDIELTHRRLESGCPTQSVSRICASLHDFGHTDGDRNRTASVHAN